MLLEYTSEDQTVIKVTLEEGESIGNLNGPIVAFVPTDPANTDFSAIEAAGQAPTVYRPPGAPA